MLLNNTKKIALLLFVTIFISGALYAAEKVETIKIKTPSVQCGMCKATIEKALKAVDGVVKSNVDVKETKITTVKYKTDITNPDKIRLAISKAGYVADSVQADKKAYDKLPTCCKVPEGKTK
ncbi:MAG: heavy-metal-associated domain-containing protein [Candidatus Kapabacteria bacterium]|nr:heavy-metal-associated domain-containing protein [Candidatus Kapabacteria bacterium]